MPSQYWIKLYVEALDDPKMALLPDRLYRRVIELFMAAGRTGADGILPPINDLAWILRMSPEDLRQDIEALLPTGIISTNDDGALLVTNFARRQSPSASERSRQFRKRNYSGQYDGPEQNANRTRTEREQKTNKSFLDNREQITETDNREQITEAEPEPETEPDAKNADFVGVVVVPPPVHDQIVQSYQEEIGELTPSAQKAIARAENDYPAAWIPQAIAEATAHNVRTWSYVTGILKRWKEDGAPSSGSAGRRARAGPDFSDLDQWAKEGQ